jgi:hypothetical protein
MLYFYSFRKIYNSSLVRYIYILLLLLFFQFSNNGYAQIWIGPVVGINYSSVFLEDKDLKNDYKIRPVLGYHGGVDIAFRVRKRFFLHVPVVYSTKGKMVKGITDPSLEHSVTYRFIEIPMLYMVDFKKSIGQGSKTFKFSLGLGPNVAYWLGGSGKLYNSDFAEANLPKVSYNIVFDKADAAVANDKMLVSDPNRLQLGLNLAGSFVFEPRPDKKVLVTLRYELGHTYYAKSGGMIANTYYQDALRSRNHGLRISAAFLLDTKVEQRKKGKSTIKRSKV